MKHPSKVSESPTLGLDQPYPTAKRLADDIIVVECSMAALPNRLRPHPVETNRLPTLKEDHRVS